MEFAEAISRWETFYFAVAGVGAALAGLVFVALALYFQRLLDEENIPLRSWSTYTVTHFAQVIFISILFLVPDQTPLGLGLPLLIGAAYGLLIFLSGLRYMYRNRPSIYLYSLLAHFIVPGATYLLMAAVALMLMNGQSMYLPLMVVVIIVLLLLGGHNAWSLVQNRRVPGINSDLLPTESTSKMGGNARTKVPIEKDNT